MFHAFLRVCLLHHIKAVQVGLALGAVGIRARRWVASAVLARIEAFQTLQGALRSAVFVVDRVQAPEMVGARFVTLHAFIQTLHGFFSKTIASNGSVGFQLFDAGQEVETLLAVAALGAAVHIPGQRVVFIRTGHAVTAVLQARYGSRSQAVQLHRSLGHAHGVQEVIVRQGHEHIRSDCSREILGRQLIPTDVRRDNKVGLFF